jgi:dTDP-glucose 4,6-dehydratase
MHNVLITGGAGFIGSNFVRYLLRTDPDLHLVTLDALTYAGSQANLNFLPDPSRHTFVRGNICDQAQVEDLLRRHRIDTLVHFAAETHVDRSILGPAPFVQTNVIGTFTLLEAVSRVWMGEGHSFDGLVRFHHVSTDEVYGSLGPHDSPLPETAPYAPSSPYAASKAASDHLVRAYARTYGLPVTITNCSNNYGPHQFPEKLIPLVILNAREGKPLPVYGDGQQVRDWLFVVDHCEAIYQVLLSGRTGETYHIGGNNQPTNLEVVSAICSILDERMKTRKHADLIQMVVDRPGHDRRYALDTHKIRSELGWQPHHDLLAGLQETVDWYLTHVEWVETIRARDDYKAWVEKNYARRREEL